MLTKWFGTRTPCQTERGLFVRPDLEALEDRLPPSSVHGMVGDNGGGGGPPGHQQVHENIHINIHINGEFNSMGGAFLGLPVATQQSLLSGLFQSAAKQSTGTTALQDAAKVVIDEFTLAVDDVVNMIAPGTIPTSTTDALMKDISTIEAKYPGDTFRELGSLAYADAFTLLAPAVGSLSSSGSTTGGT